MNTTDKPAPRGKTTLTNRRPRRSKATDEFYINTKEFHNEIVEYYQTEFGSTPSAALGRKLLILSKKLGNSHKFQGYPFREEMESSAVEKMLQALLKRKYDPQFLHPFAYFTRIAMNAFVGCINKEKSESDGLRKYQEHMYSGTEDVDSGWDNVKRSHAAHQEEDFFND